MYSSCLIDRYRVMDNKSVKVIQKCQWNDDITSIQLPKTQTTSLTYQSYMTWYTASGGHIIAISVLMLYILLGLAVRGQLQRKLFTLCSTCWTDKHSRWPTNRHGTGLRTSKLSVKRAAGERHTHSLCSSAAIFTWTQLMYKILWDEGMNLKLMMCAKGHMA